MNQVSAGSPVAPLSLTVCKACNLSWLSPEERAALPAQAPTEPQAETPPKDLSSLPPEAAQLAAIHQVELIGERARNENQFDASRLPLWQKVLAIVGMPVEDDVSPSSRFPWATTLLVLGTLAASLYFFTDWRSPDEYGFIPRAFDREGGLTFLSSFLVHGGWVHLLTNMYFLFVFGKAVEREIGWLGFLALIVFSTICGNALTLVFDPESDIPHVGASGGIAGVLLFYGFTFPQKRLVFFMSGTYGLMMPRLVRFPAWAVLCLWILLQLFGATFQQRGMSTVSYSSHLGGLAAGLACWLLWKWVKSGGLMKAER
jgi:membrane associated rhomboid family serine protease